MRHLVGIDVGGTFTDFVAFDPQTQKLDVWKTLSTPKDPIEGILSGLENYDANAIEAVDHLRLGTTIATNAILERKGSVVAYVTTRGFRDVPFIQRGKRKSHYDLTWIKSKPLAKRRYCFEIGGRITARGEEYEPLNENEIKTLAKTIANDPNIKAIAVCLLFSYVNPIHERRVADIFSNECPDKPVSISYSVLPKWKEYERASTTIADDYIRPLVSHHIGRVEEQFTKKGIGKRVAVIKSNGGEMSLDAAKNAPIQMTLSGPTGGVVGAKHISSLVGVEHLVTLDMGGTSTNVSTVVSGRESFTTSFEIEFRVPIQIPMIDIRTMGAGGGSLAWIDKGGMLRVGPQSAGAQPGPACYDQGGNEATVTDANVVLGRISPSNFLGGSMQLNQEVANQAIGKIAESINKNIDQTALAIVQIANNNMIGALRSVLTERGLDPRDFTLLGFGGAGPVHVSDLMYHSGIPSGIIPNHPGQFSAFGFTMTDARIDLERTTQMTSKAFNRDHANKVIKELSQEAVESLNLQGHKGEINLYRSLEMRYFGQNHELEVPISFDEFNDITILSGWEQFHQAHRDRFNFDIPGEIIELISVKLTAVAVTERPDLPTITKGHDKPEPVGSRLVTFDEGKLETRIYQRDQLKMGHSLEGPVVIEEPASVTVVRPEQKVLVDEYGHLLLGKIASTNR